MMTTKVNHFLWLTIFCAICSSNMAHALPDAKITVSVLGEDGKPIEGAEVGTGFERNTGFGTAKVPQKGFSDGNGMFTATHSTTGYVSYGAIKDGYYRSVGVYRYKTEKMGHWAPWNPTVQVVLRKIEKPIPMYHRDLDIEIPVIGKEAGFDLIEYDWVSPYGKGKHDDFVFKLDKKFKSRDEFDSTLTVSFHEKNDGIQIVKEDRRYGSSFKLPRFAPKSGYRKKVTHLKKRNPGIPIEDDYADDNNYIFRVRSEEKDGKLWSAMYGKILGEIRFDPMMSKTAYILFEYYLNPDYTRNLEHGENLFKLKK